MIERLDKLDVLLEKLEGFIDDDHYAEVEKLHLDSLNYRPVDRVPLSVIVDDKSEMEMFSYTECFTNPEKMLYNELCGSFGSIWYSAQLGDDYPLHIRSNHGLCAIPSMFGAEVTILNDSMPWVEPMDPDELKKVVASGNIDLKKGIVPRVQDTYAYFKERLSAYPKCSRNIHLSQPDMQGPFDNAHLLYGADIFYELYDEPEFIHDLLDLVTEAYLQYHAAVKPLLNDDAGDKEAIYVHGGIYGGRAIIKDDTAIINLSQRHYEEFALPYNKRLEEALGSVAIHYCGRVLPWHVNVLSNDRMRTINFGNPDLNNLRDLYAQWKQKKTPIVFWGYNSPIEYVASTIRRAGVKTGLTAATLAPNFEEAKSIWARHKAGELF